MSDLISRQEVLGLKTIAPIAPVINGETVHYEEVVFVRELEKLPSVEPERKPGIWTHEDTGVWTCGVCGEEVGEMGDEYGVPKYNFCPYCGADMTGRRVRNDR